MKRAKNAQVDYLTILKVEKLLLEVMPTVPSRESTKYTRKHTNTYTDIIYKCRGGKSKERETKETMRKNDMGFATS